MNPNPNFSVRFYVRTTKTQGDDSLTPLRAKVWISATKQYVYFSTNVTTTKRKWTYFATDGTPSIGADPQLINIVDTYLAAAQLVLSGAAVNNRIHLLSSEELTSRINAVVGAMQKQEDNQPILVFTKPTFIPLCRNCQFCGDRCRADWEEDMEADIAPDKALYFGKCTKWRASQELSTADVIERLMAFFFLIKKQKPDLSTNDTLGEAVDILAYLRANPNKAFSTAQRILERNQMEEDHKNERQK